MTYREYKKPLPRNPDGSQHYSSIYLLTSGNSPRVNGKLRLQPNSLYLDMCESKGGAFNGSYAGSNMSNVFLTNALRSQPEIKAAYGAARDIAYAKLRGKLYKGNASLGVTFASWRQSSEMIVKNSQVISSMAEDLSSIASRQKLTRRLANRHLEVVFGWQPLLADIHAAAMTVIQSADQLHFVRASHVKGYSRISRSERPGWRSETDAYGGTVRVTYASQVRIANPNRWLLERAGLMNPAAVAWDLVPWSFLVNMFSNTGSLVNSLTDFVGLSFEGMSETSTYVTARESTLRSTYPSVGAYTMSSQGRGKFRNLVASPAPPRTLTLRVPEMNLGLAATAVALMVQQAVPMVRLISTLRR